MIDRRLYDELCGDVLPLCRRLSATPRYAVALGGSHGKGLSDERSDFDFRTYYEAPSAEGEWRRAMQDLDEQIARWKARGVEIDGVWPRRIADIERELEPWLRGDASPAPYVWCVWGYHLPTDIYNQAIVEDPFGIARAWKDRLGVYPDALRAALLERHGGSLRYWRGDYHYASKMNRGDRVFLASLSARLVHDVMQVVYALNRFYFPGDGLNLAFTPKFAVRPEGLEARVEKILYPGGGSDCLERQYRDLAALIDDTLALI